MPTDRSQTALVILATLLLALTGCTSTPESDRGDSGSGVDGYELARNAYRAGDYMTAAERLIPVAERGDPRAQYALGYMYYYGKGVLPDRERALQLFQNAAGQGNRRAAEALRILSEGGTGENSLGVAPAPVSGSPPAASGREETSTLPDANSEESPMAGATDPAEGAAGASSVEVAESDPGGSGSRTASAAAAAAPPLKVAGGSSEWLKEQDPDKLTIQLVAGHELEGVQRFVAEHGLGDRAAVVEKWRNGVPWYVVLYGIYEGLEKAEEALEGLPAALRVNGPWIRRLGDALE
ncbi:MAG: hypothetical protein Kow006_25980 [Gammaproteobacteria bacterium]